MGRMHPRIIVALGAMFCAVNALGQTVYESKDKSGAPVFSDRPTPGATQLNLPAPNVSHAPTMKVEPLTEPSPPPYTDMRIVTPQNNGTVHSNTGEFHVQVQVGPPLDTARGDVIVVKLDGNRLDATYSSPQFTISTGQFAAAGSDVALHQLEVAVFNAAGKPRIVSDPVNFYVRRSIVRHGGRR